MPRGALGICLLAAAVNAKPSLSLCVAAAWKAYHLLENMRKIALLVASQDPRSDGGDQWGPLASSGSSLRRIGCLNRSLSRIDVAAVDERFAAKVIDPGLGICVTVGGQFSRAIEAVEVASKQALQAAEDRTDDTAFRRGCSRWRGHRRPLPLLPTRLRTRIHFRLESRQQPIVNASVGAHSCISLKFAYRSLRPRTKATIRSSRIITESSEPPLDFRDPMFSGLAVWLREV